MGNGKTEEKSETFLLNVGKPELEKIRNKLIDRLYFGFIILLVPALSMSVFRITQTGWKWVYLIHILFAIAGALAFKFSSKLSARSKSNILNIIFLVASFSAAATFGIASAYYITLLTVVISTILFGKRQGYIYLSISIIGLIGVAFLHCTKTIKTGIDFNIYNFNSTTWVNLIFILFWMMVIIVLGIGLFYDYFQQSIEALEQKSIEQEMAKEKLITSEQKYRLLFENAGDAILTLDENTFIIDMNDYTCRLLGYSREELLGMNIKQIVPSRELEKQTLYIESVKQKKDTLDYRTLLRKDGTEVETEINNRLIEGKGYIAIIRDITERFKAQRAIKESEEKYHTLVEHAADAIFLLDHDLSFTHVNSGICKMTGYTEKEFAQMKLSDLYPAHELERRPLSVEHLRLHKKLLIERKWKRKDATELDVEISTKVIEGKGYLNIARDITERKKVAEELEKTVSELNDRHNEMMQFSYIVSHNLRAPIASILGLANIINEPKVSLDEKLKITNHILTSVIKMDDMLKDLNVILASQSTLNKNKERTSINDILNSILDTLSQQIIDSAVEIETYIADPAQEIYTIKAYMESILYNLINNAIKYKSINRTLKLHISATKENDEFTITVADNGIGIDLDAHGKNIFGLYKRFHLETEGKGLGLHMTKLQVEALGGKIEVDSKIDIGTIFTISIPAA